MALAEILMWLCQSLLLSLGSVSLFLVIFLCVAHWYRQETWQELKKLPGPREVIPFLNNVSRYRTLRKKEHLLDFNVQAFADGYGGAVINKNAGLFRFYLGLQPVVAIFRADYAQTLLSSPTIIDKSSEYKLLHPWLGTGLLTSTGSKWKSRRKLLTPAFHFRILEEFMPMMNEQSKILVEVLRQKIDKPWTDIVPLVTHCTLDIICETVMGVSVNAQKDSSSLYVQSINKLGEAFIKRIEIPWLLSDQIFYRSSLGKIFSESLKVLHDFTRKVIQERKEELQKAPSSPMRKKTDDIFDWDVGQKKKKPFLDLLLVNHLQENNLSEEDIREEVDTFMFEGHDTTAMGISWALYLIGLHPEIQRKIQEELDGIFKGDNERDVTTDDLRDMNYLECVLKECQRLFPSVPFIGREVTEDTKLGEYTIPKGTSLSLFIYALHRDPKYFPKPEEFIPERFLPENSKNRHPFAYVPFSAGSRNCIGQKFAMMEEKIVISHVLRNLSLRSLDPRDKLRLVSEMVLRSKDGVRAKIMPKT